MCIQNCRNFIWGGSGTAVVSVDSSCSCLCEAGHLDYNILGTASCVPALGHAIFGFAGLFSNVLVLCHALHSLRRQVGNAYSIWWN